MRPQAQKIVMQHARLRAALEDAVKRLDYLTPLLWVLSMSKTLQDIAADLRKALEEGAE